MVKLGRGLADYRIKLFLLLVNNEEVRGITSTMFSFTAISDEALEHVINLLSIMFK